MRARLARGFARPRVSIVGHDRTIAPPTSPDAEASPFNTPFTDMPSNIPDTARKALVSEAHALIESDVALFGLISRSRNSANCWRAMRASAILIITARRDIVVEERALAEALRAGVIGAAGLDVYEEEPAIGARPLDLDNVVLLPHLGSATLETRSAMGHPMINNLVDSFAGREPRDRVA